MKVLFEVPSRVVESQISQFQWLKNNNNRLFIIEEGKKLRTISTTDEIGKELHTATLTDSKTCTTFAWNKDSSLLALVVDKRKVYIWDVETGKFVHYRYNLMKNSNNSNTNSISKKVKREVELLAWSRISNKLLISLSDGQLILTNFQDYSLSNPTEKFISNSQGVLSNIISIECHEQLDLFVCITNTSEILFMTFDGDLKYYAQNEDVNINQVRVSPLDVKENETLWLLYRTSDDKLFFKRLQLKNCHARSNAIVADLVYEEKVNPLCKLINFYWISEKRVVLCFSDGVIILLETKTIFNHEGEGFILKSEIILDLKHELCQEDEMVVGDNSCFKSFELVSDQTSKQKHINEISLEDCGEVEEENSFSFVVLTDYQLFYYKFFNATYFTKICSLEKVDDLDLTGSLKKLNLKLEKVAWSFDCSMLALQLANGHILVYRTRLQDYMVVSSQSKTAYLSNVNEVTILNYKLEQDELSGSDSEIKNEGKSSPSYSSGNNALVVHLDFKPSLIAVGPKHMAVALNNRVKYYHIDSNVATSTTWYSNEQEYLSNVISICLCSNFVAILFDDQRLKLHALKMSSDSRLKHFDPSNDRRSCAGSEEILDERFFPDPTKPEVITSFILTEDLFIYSIDECQIYRLNVFSLKSWSVIQTLEYSDKLRREAGASLINLPFLKLKPNEKGNKIVCFTKESKKTSPRTANVYLYDLYSNKLVEFCNQYLYDKLYRAQLKIFHSIMIDMPRLPEMDQAEKRASPNLGCIKDAIWDTDGKTLLLVERRCIHTFVVLDHTLEREDTTLEYISTYPKASSYTALYASHGIVSYQTSLGRVINLISESHDEDLNLNKLRQRIQEVSASSQRAVDGETDDDSNTSKTGSRLNDQKRVQVGLIRLKLEYLRKVVALYSLSKLKEICHYLLNDEQLNSVTNTPSKRLEDVGCITLDNIIWRQLAGWALYTSNLRFAQLIYRKHGLPVEARVIEEIQEDLKHGIDSKSVMVTRLLILLGCDSEDDD